MDADAPPLPPEPSADAPAPPVKQEPDVIHPPTNGDDNNAAPSIKQELGETIDYANADELLKEFYAEVREVDRDNEVNRILSAFKLNPYEQLGVPFDADLDLINRTYRKTSLLVHPDKCRHPKAKDAFDALKQAQQTLLNDELRQELILQLNVAKEFVRQQRAKDTKRDRSVHLASMIHEEGREGVEAEWEQSPEFHHLWKLHARDTLAKVAWRKRKLVQRLEADKERVSTEEKEEGARMKRQRDHEKGWEKTRENRVGNWRSFVKGSKDKGKKVGGLKPPKAKTFDEDKVYMQRPTTEQFRPPPMAVPKPQRE